LRVERRANNPSSEKINTVTIPSKTKPRTQINVLNTGHGKRSAELKIATWNTTSLFRTGACQNLVETLDALNIDIAVLQEIRRTGIGQMKV
jgi:hypothetical protein